MTRLPSQFRRLATHCGALALVLFAGASPTQAVSFVSSDFDLSAQAEAANTPADEFDSDSDMVALSNLTSYDDAVAATASTSTASSSSNVIFEAAFTPTLITLDASGTADANGGADHPASAFAQGDVKFVFSSAVAVDYDLNAGLSAGSGDANLFMRLREVGATSSEFLYEVFASGFEEPMQTGTLGPGTYEFSAGISPSAHADDFGGVFETNASLFAELELMQVPEPTAAAALVVGLGLLRMRRRR